MFRFNAALSVSLGLTRLFTLTVTTNYVLTSVFRVCQAYEKMDSSSQADGQVYVGF